MGSGGTVEGGKKGNRWIATVVGFLIGFVVITWGIHMYQEDHRPTAYERFEARCHEQGGDFSGVINVRHHREGSCLLPWGYYSVTGDVVTGIADRPYYP